MVKKIFALEGIDGSGKTTLGQKVSSKFKSDGIPLTFARWDSNAFQLIIDNYSRHGRLSREAISIAACLSFIHMTRITQLESPSHVLYDRFSFSGMLKDFQRNENMNFVINNYAFGPTADIVFYLEVTPEKALERILKTRKLTIYETEILVNSYKDENREVINKYNTGHISEEILINSFLMLKEKDILFYNKYLKTNKNTVTIDATLSLEEIVEIVSNCIIQKIRS